MKSIEYQLVKDILKETWTKSIYTSVQNWTSSNCLLIREQIKKVTGIFISVRSIIRFAQLTESESIKRNTTKYILAMYVNGEHAINGKHNTTAWDNMLKAKNGITETPTPMFDGFEGKYQVYSKSKLLKKTLSDSTLEIDKNGDCIFRYISNKKEKFWKGKAIKKKAHLFITLENEIDILYLIIKGTFQYDYWIGVFLAVDYSTEMPNSSIFLITKEKFETEDKQKRIELFFNQRSDGYRLSINPELLVITNSFYDLDRVTKYLNEEITSIIGNWVVYSSDGNELYYQSRMAINSSQDIVYEGLRRDYMGNVVIKNQDVYIYLNGEKNALLCFSLNYLKLDKINYILATYTTIGTSCSCPTYGSAVLVRSKLDFKRLEKKEITKDTADYEMLKQIGILDKLTLKRFKYHKNIIELDSE